MPQNVVRHEAEHLYADQPRTAEGRQLSQAILQLRRCERIQAERAQRASGLSHLDLTALRYLVQGHRDHRDLSPKDLIVMLDTSSATVTNVVERLVQRGFVTRVQHPRDRRAHYLVPTGEAIRRVEDSLMPHHSAIVAAIDDLTPEEARRAADALLKIADALDELAASATAAERAQAADVA
ncbi:MarR family transcriptional regulator [Microbacterium sp. 4R-513]|uniref:MarR family winged helix-turn-helix transcriptional regulator n=1 Tax=Microbacterium sp. 4R-513 TaxID=2567934 RepID=UPI0013E18CA5|nr:MarR family transcriptional regulator [Microbacterium sp. 4R-513]QIG39062.1 MarR family transcriptional regulator [Microbacterium sp. 4R-513]